MAVRHSVGPEAQRLAEPFRNPKVLSQDLIQRVSSETLGHILKGGPIPVDVPG